jgi:hypothetical protein
MEYVYSDAGLYVNSAVFGDWTAGWLEGACSSDYSRNGLPYQKLSLPTNPLLLPDLFSHTCVL